MTDPETTTRRPRGNPHVGSLKLPRNSELQAKTLVWPQIRRPRRYGRRGCSMNEMRAKVLG